MPWKHLRDLAAERGAYASYDGSLWSQGILPIDSLRLLKEERGEEYLETDAHTTLDWQALREKIRTQKMRNSNVLAIAPTATIANITGVSQSIEPAFKNLYVKSNLSGEFTWVNQYLVRDLKTLEMWDDVMVNDLKYYDGSVQKINRIPNDLKKLYMTAFEMDFSWLVRCASRRQKWIDQAQSLNFYIDQPSGKVLDELYRFRLETGTQNDLLFALKEVRPEQKNPLLIRDRKTTKLGWEKFGKFEMM